MPRITIDKKLNQYREILGVDLNADRHIIKRAFIILAKKYHPDKYDSKRKNKAEKLFNIIHKAYAALMEFQEKKDMIFMQNPIDVIEDKTMDEDFNKLAQSYNRYHTQNTAMFGIMNYYINSQEYYGSLENSINKYYDNMKGDFTEQLKKRSRESFSSGDEECQGYDYPIHEFVKRTSTNCRGSAQYVGGSSVGDKKLKRNDLFDKSFDNSSFMSFLGGKQNIDIHF